MPRESSYTLHSERERDSVISQKSKREKEKERERDGVWCTREDISHRSWEDSLCPIH